MSEWQELPLSEVVELVGGGTPKTTISEYWNGDIPWLSVVDFNTGRKYVTDTEKKITKAGFENSSTKLLNAGDIIISARGTVGAMAVLSKPMTFNQSCYGLRGVANKSDSSFIYYLVKDAVEGLQQISHGGVFDTITRDTFKDITLPIPPIEEQKAIASVLSSLDDKIDLLHRQNTTLERMAETLFRQWFIEEAHEDWEELRLENIASVISGYNHKQNELCDSGDYLLSMGSAIKKYGFSIEASRHIKTEGILEKQLCEANDIFLTTRDVTQDAELLGSPGIIPPCIKEKVVLGSNLYKLEMKNKKLSTSVIYFLLRSEIYREYVKEVASGTSILMLKKSDLDSFCFKVPPIPTLVKLDEILTNILYKLNANFAQEITIKKIRDNLLPKLMSGEVRVI